MSRDRISRLEMDPPSRSGAPPGTPSGGKRAITRYFGIERLLEVKERLEKEPVIELEKPTPDAPPSLERQTAEVRKKIPIYRMLQKAEQEENFRRQSRSRLIPVPSRDQRLFSLKLQIGWNVVMGLVKIAVGLFGLQLMIEVLRQPRTDWRPILHVAVTGVIFYLLRFFLRRLERRRASFELNPNSSILLDRGTEIVRILSWTAGLMFIVAALGALRPETLQANWWPITQGFLILSCVFYFFRRFVIFAMGVPE